MTSRRRPVLRVLVVLLLAGAGALGALALHWYVVQPTDEELIAAARGIDIEGLVTPDDPRVSGRWARSFDRGGVHMDATADTPLTREAVVTALEAQGWSATDGTDFAATGTVYASRAGVDVDVHLRVTRLGGTEATVWLVRGDVTPSLTTTILLGAGVGALGGLALGRRRAR